MESHGKPFATRSSNLSARSSCHSSKPSPCRSCAEKRRIAGRRDPKGESWKRDFTPVLSFYVLIFATDSSNGLHVVVRRSLRGRTSTDFAGLGGSMAGACAGQPKSLKTGGIIKECVGRLQKLAESLHTPAHFNGCHEHAWLCPGCSSFSAQLARQVPMPFPPSWMHCNLRATC